MWSEKPRILSREVRCNTRAMTKTLTRTVRRTLGSLVAGLLCVGLLAITPSEAQAIERSRSFVCVNSVSGGSITLSGSAGLNVVSRQATAHVPAGCFAAGETVVWTCTPLSSPSVCPIEDGHSVSATGTGSLNFKARVGNVSAGCYQFTAAGQSSGASVDTRQCITASQALLIDGPGILIDVAQTLAVTGISKFKRLLVGMGLGVLLLGVAMTLLVQVKNRSARDTKQPLSRSPARQ